MQKDLRLAVKEYMRKRNTATSKRSPRSGKDDSKKLSKYIVLFGCGLILISGFFFAARQHFAAMDYGIKNSRLRKQIDDLKAEKQRLLFARELSVSPNEIKRSAEKAGLFGSRRENAAAPRLASTGPDMRMTSSSRDSEPTIIRTGSVQPTAPQTQKAVQRIERTDNKAKIAVSSE
jgi:hypothetical protein